MAVIDKIQLNGVLYDVNSSSFNDDDILTIDLNGAEFGEPNPVNADTLNGRPANDYVLKEELNYQNITNQIQFKNSFEDAGTKLYITNNIFFIYIRVKIPTITSSDWIDIISLPISPLVSLYGRTSIRAGGPARDWGLISSGIFRMYLVAEDSGNTLNLPISFIKK